MSSQGPLFTSPEPVVGLKPRQRSGPPVLPAAFTPGGLRRNGRRFGGWLPVVMPLPHLMGMWDVIQMDAVEAGRDPVTLRMALRVNPELTDTGTGRDRMPQAGTLGQYSDYARAAAGGCARTVRGLRADKTPATLAERVDLADRFLDGVRCG